MFICIFVYILCLFIHISWALSPLTSKSFFVADPSLFLYSRNFYEESLYTYTYSFVTILPIKIKIDLPGLCLVFSSFPDKLCRYIFFLHITDSLGLRRYICMYVCTDFEESQTHRSEVKQDWIQHRRSFILVNTTTFACIIIPTKLHATHMLLCWLRRLLGTDGPNESSSFFLLCDTVEDYLK